MLTLSISTGKFISNNNNNNYNNIRSLFTKNICSSICGLNATVVDLPMGLYPVSKFAMTAMNETLKKEIKENNDKIRVTVSLFIYFIIITN